jgi:hypothetical protein
VSARIVVAMMAVLLLAAPALAAPPVGTQPVAAQPATVQQPVGADLSNLTYSATSNLSATLVSPAGGTASTGIATKILVATVAGAGVELRVNGRVISAKQIGMRSVNKKTGETRYEYYGVVLEAGPNTVEVTPLGADDTRGPTARYTIFGPGKPAHFVFNLDRPLHADGGVTMNMLSITATDRWNNPAMPGAIIKVSIVAGDLRFLIASATSKGQPVQYHTSSAVELPVAAGGLNQIHLVSGLLPGEAVLQVTAADVVYIERFYIDPNLRKPFVTGLVTAGAGAVPGFAGMPANVPDGQQSRLGRIAVFGTGVVNSDTLATVAYDTANVLQQNLLGPYVVDPYDRPFQTYGDASYQYDDALSRDHLYARLDRYQSSLVWGEFRPDQGSPDSDGGYHLLVDGAKLELGTSRTRIMGFTANNDFAYARQQFNPTGLSIAGQILHPDIVVGSDVVTLVVLDKRTGAVLSQTALVRNVDYTLDYTSGLMRFINIPLPYDDHFNPQVVMVQYEYGGANVHAETTGGHASLLLNRAGTLRFNLGYVNDSSGDSNFTLFEQSLQGTTHGGAWSIAHIATNGPVFGATIGPSESGGAVHAMFTQVSGSNRIGFDFMTATTGFNNPFGGFATPGLTSYNFEAKHLFNSNSDITLDYNLQQNLATAVSGITTSDQSQASLVYRHAWADRLVAKIGLQTNTVTGVDAPLSSSSGTVSGSNAQAILGLAYRITPRLALGVEDITNIGGGTETPSEPAQTMAQLSYTVPNNTKFFVRDRWSAQPTSSFATSSAPFTTSSESTQSFSVGFERDMSSATAVDSEYGVDHTANGQDIYSAFGVREKIKLGKNLQGNAFAQDGNAVGAGMEGFFVYGLNATYSNARNFTAAASWQNRTGSQPGSTLTAGMAGPLGNDFAVQATVQDSRNLGLYDNQDSFGLAWRPSNNDRGATLFEYDHRIGNISTLGEQTDVIMFQQVYRPTANLELAGRYAYKMDGGAYYLPHTSLVGLRADERFGPRYDLAVETQLVAPSGIPAAKSTDFAVENGYRIGGSARVALGYNFAGSADPTLTGAPVRRGVYITVTSIVDRFFGWGKQQ